MGLEFEGNAISLSGLTGSKIKSEIIGEYYPFWWKITSGGERANHEWNTAIIELDAATGEMYIKDTKETVLGSSGHALNLKCNNEITRNLKIVLVEKEDGCYSHLKKVIAKRWPKVDIAEAEGPLSSNKSNIYLMNLKLDEALSSIARLDLRSSLFFFDPLRSYAYETIQKVARARIKTYYKTGTEFIIFVFTSDWFLGRDDFAGLPTTLVETDWSESEKHTVVEADGLFGSMEWRARILNNQPIDKREYSFIELYKQCLNKWFRYVLPMPFNPKGKQIFHLILCSNYEAGVSATKRFFCGKTNNPVYKPDNRRAFAEFSKRHGELLIGLRGNQKPKQWRILWKTITGHEDGICDYKCRDFEEIEPMEKERIKLLEWLATEGYSIEYATNDPWGLQIVQYKINWQLVKEVLDIEPPPPLEPLSLKHRSLKEINE